MFRRGAVLIGLGLLVVGCAGFESTAADLKTRLSEIDVQETLGDLTDCDTLSATFVKLVLVNRILEIDTETADGALFIDQILEEVQAPGLP